jgi:neutral ceramidase
MRTLASAVHLSTVVVLLALGPARAESTLGLRAGAARIDITPDKPVTLSGYASRKGLSTGVHDPLSARVLAFEAGAKRLVLVSVDIIGFYDGTDEYLRGPLLKEFGLQPSELFLCAIHTHAAPSPTVNRERGNPNNVEYMETLLRKLTGVIRQALDGLRPASLGLGVGYCPIGANRRELRVSDKGESSIVLGRNPYGQTDKEVLVMKVARPDGTPMAVAFDYATHGTSLGYDNYTLSGDVPGLAEQFVEKIVGGGAIAPAFIGASGDVDPWYRVLPGFNAEPGWVAEPVLLGTFLGEEVVHVVRDIKQTGATDRLATRREVLQLPGKPGDDLSPGTGSGTTPLVVTVARLGDVALVGLGGEMVTQIGAAIKAGSPCEHTFVITHCNGAAGYLAPKELHVQDGYEVKSSHFAPEAADIVIRESIRLLHSL